MSVKTDTVVTACAWIWAGDFEITEVEHAFADTIKHTQQDDCFFALWLTYKFIPTKQHKACGCGTLHRPAVAVGGRAGHPINARHWVVSQDLLLPLYPVHQYSSEGRCCLFN